MIQSHEVATAARGCRALRRAAVLAEWARPGRPVTGKRVLRRADVAAACAAIGVTAPERLRSAADVPDLQLPWTAAIAAGLLSVEGSRVVPGPAGAGWHAAADDEVLTGWCRGLAEALADTFDQSDPADALEIGRLVLTVLAADPPPVRGDLYALLVDVLDATEPALVRITLSAAFARARKPITYVYDLGAHWEHEIVLEKAVEPDPSLTYPLCVDGRGDAPVEDWNEEDEEPAWITFDQGDINTRLARSSDLAQEIEVDLQNDVEVILTDAYDEAEQMTAFLTVLEVEINFPVPATLLDNPVIITGLDEDVATVSLLARCAGTRKHVALADVEFRPGTVEAWLHAAYLTHLGRQPASVTPPSRWSGLSDWVT